MVRATFKPLPPAATIVRLARWTLPRAKLGTISVRSMAGFGVRHRIISEQPVLPQVSLALRSRRRPGWKVRRIPRQIANTFPGPSDEDNHRESLHRRHLRLRSYRRHLSGWMEQTAFHYLHTGMPHPRRA